MTQASKQITIVADSCPRTTVAIEIIGAVHSIELIATSRSLRESKRLSKVYGAGRWRKLKGTALVRLPDGVVVKAAVHWYEAHGIGKKEIKIKRVLDE